MVKSNILLNSAAFAIGCLVVFLTAAPIPALAAHDNNQLETENPRAVANSLFQSAHLNFDRGKLQEALDYYGKALPLWRAIGDRDQEAGTLNGMGRAYDQLGERQKALEYYNQALALERQIGDRRLEAAILGNIGVAYRGLGENQKALQYYGLALSLWQAVADRSGEAITLSNIAGLHQLLGENDSALKYSNEALASARAVGDLSQEATALNLIGAIYHALDDNQKALDYYNQALPLWRAAGSRSGEARELFNIGQVYERFGELQKALDHYNQALSLKRAVGDRVGEAMALNDIGLFYDRLGNRKYALQLFNQSLSLERAVDDRLNESSTLNNMGLAYSGLGERQRALEYYNQALQAARSVGERRREASTLHNIGNEYSALDEPEKALDYLNQALTLRRNIGDRSGEGITLACIAWTYHLLGEPQKALGYYDQSLALERTLGARPAEAAILGSLEYAFAASQPDLAILFGKQAVNVLQSIRRDNSDMRESLRAEYENSIEGYYRYLADLLVQRERFGEAEEVLDLLKDKEASDFIRRDSVSDQLHSATLLDSEKKSLARYDQIVDQVGGLGQKKAALLAKADKGPLTPAELAEEATLDHDLNAANTVLQKFLDEEEKSLAPTSAEAKRVGELKEAEGLQDALAKLGPDVVAIYTLVTPDKYVALLVTPGARKAYTSPIKEADLNKKIFDFRQQLQNPNSDPRPLAQELYGIVFPEGLRHDLDAMHARIIMWSIDSTLRYIPFAALYDGHDYLVQSFRQSLITPASIPYLTEEPLRQWSGIGFGVSDGSGVASSLPSVPGELRGIFRETADGRSPIPGVVVLNAAFTRQSFEDDLRKKRNPVVHIATHFDSRPGVAANSSLLLGDGALSLAEIEAHTRLFNGVDLLTLSACNTAFTNKSEDGREVDSFGTIAQRLGAKGVIASLWSVNDDSTARLMETMYRLRQQTPGLTKDEALRQAQLVLLDGKAKPESVTGKPDRGAVPNRPVTAGKTLSDWSHPYYWAPFILIGNWR